jgi:hypothetical protein
MYDDEKRRTLEYHGTAKHTPPAIPKIRKFNGNFVTLLPTKVSVMKPYPD